MRFTVMIPRIGGIDFTEEFEASSVRAGKQRATRIDRGLAGQVSHLPHPITLESNEGRWERLSAGTRYQRTWENTSRYYSARCR